MLEQDAGYQRPGARRRKAPSENVIARANEKAARRALGEQANVTRGEAARVE
jgi:hypothetical protein